MVSTTTIIVPYRRLYLLYDNLEYISDFGELKEKEMFQSKQFLRVYTNYAMNNFTQTMIFFSIWIKKNMQSNTCASCTHLQLKGYSEDKYGKKISWKLHMNTWRRQIWKRKTNVRNEKKNLYMKKYKVWLEKKKRKQNSDYDDFDA